MKGIFTAIQNGFFQTWRYKRIVGLLYLATLLFAFLVAWPFKSFLEGKLGNSLVVQDLVKGFDYTILNDFNNASGAGFDPILSQSLLMIIPFFLLLIFFQGGIASHFVQQPDRFEKSEFWSNNAEYFWRMLRLTLYFGAIQVLVLIGFYSLFMWWTSGMSNTVLTSDKTIFDTIQFLLPFYFLSSAFFFMWQDYSKLTLVQSDQNKVYKSIFTAFKILKSNLLSCFFCYLFILALAWALFWFNSVITSLFAIESSTTIFLSFFLSQLFLLGRYFMKNWNLATAFACMK